MANEKRSWTNADLRRRETLQAGDPRLTQEGPWRTTGRPESMGPMDEPDIDSILDSARAFLAQTDPNRPTRANAERRELDQRASQAQSGLAAADQRLADVRGRTFGEKALSTLDMMALPAMAVPGLNLAAGAYMTGRGVQGAAEDPNAMNVSMAGLGLLPYIGPASRMLRGAKGAAGAADEAGSVLTDAADAFSDVLGRRPKATPLNTRPSEGGYVANRGSAARRSPAEAPGQAAPWTRPQDSPVDRFMPNRPAAADTSRFTDHAAQRFTRAADDVDQFMPNRPGDEIAQRFAESELHPSVRGMDSLIDRYMPNISGSVDDLFSRAERATKGASSLADDVADDAIQMVDDAPPVRQVETAPASELADLIAQARNAPASRTIQRVQPPVQRVPMGRTGNEYAGVKPFNRAANMLDPEEAAGADEFMDTELEAILNGLFGRR